MTKIADGYALAIVEDCIKGQVEATSRESLQPTDAFAGHESLRVLLEHDHRFFEVTLVVAEAHDVT